MLQLKRKFVLNAMCAAFGQRGFTAPDGAYMQAIRELRRIDRQLDLAYLVRLAS
jgi:hypothetical protein